MVDSTKITHDNNRHAYRISMDIAKEGSAVWDLTPYFKGRVGDNRFGLEVSWFYQGKPMNVDGMKPYIEGNVGNYTLDDKKNLQLNSGASVVRYVGAPSDCGPGGNATYYFPEQMFPKEGIFKGYIGLLDDRDDSKNPHISGVTIWFKVLPGIAEMGHACDYYISELEKLLEHFKTTMDNHDKDYQAKLEQSLEDIRNKYNLKAKQAEDTLNTVQASIKANQDRQDALTAELKGTQHQIEINNVVTKPDFEKMRNEAFQRLQTASTNIKAFPTANNLQTTYPNGADGVYLVGSTGHMFIYWNKSWTDCGPLINFQENNYFIKPFSDTLPLQEHKESDWLSGNNGWWKFNKVFTPGFITSITLKTKDNVKAIVGIVDKDTNKVVVLKNSTGKGEIDIPFNTYVSKPFYILLKANTFQYVMEPTSGIGYYSWGVVDGESGDDYVTIGQDMNNEWETGEGFLPFLKVNYPSISQQIIRGDIKIENMLFKGVPSYELDFNNYRKKGGYFFSSTSDQATLKNAPLGAHWGYYGLIVLPILPNYFVQIAITYSSEKGNGVYLRYVGTKEDGSFDDSNPGINQWIVLSGKSLANNRLFVAGDSITAGHPYEDDVNLSYVTQFEKQLGFNVTCGARNGAGWVYNNGIDGTIIVDNTDFTQYDVAYFAFGTNDYGNNMPLGEPDDLMPDKRTFYGALNYAIKAIYRKNPKIMLILATPILRTDHGDESTKYAWNEKNDAGFTLSQYRDAEIAVCQKYNIPFIDNTNSPFTVLSANSLLVDKLHPNVEGYRLYGSYLASRLSNIIRPYLD